jgi:hypothetical protein
VNKYEAMAIRAEALSGEMSEERAAALLQQHKDALRIITNDPSGPSDNPHEPHYNRLERVESIEQMPGVKMVEWEDGTLAKVPVVSYWAWGRQYEAADGRIVRDHCRSGPERFSRDEDGTVRQWGAASALLARLLEAAEAGGLGE